MYEVRTRIAVKSVRSISGTAPAALVTIIVADRLAHEHGRQPLDDSALPRHDLGPWPAGLSLQREVMYGDDGR